MAAQPVVGRGGAGHQVGALGLHALVHVLAKVAVGPAVEGAFLHGREVVGHQVVAQLVALVHHRPQGAGAGLPVHAVGVAQAVGKQPLVAAGAVDFPDGGAPLFGGHAVFSNVAVRADGGIELLAVRAGNQVLGPVVVDVAGGQFGQPGGGGGDGGVAFGVGKAQHRIGVGHVQVIAHQRHAKGRMQVLQEHAALVGHAVAVGVAQQHDAVGRGHAGAGALHHLAHHPAFDALVVLGRLVAFGHQHVAVGQHVHPARVVQPAGKGHHVQPGHGNGLGAFRPADGRGNVDGGNQVFFWRRQRWRRAHAQGCGGRQRLRARRRGHHQGQHPAARQQGQGRSRKATTTRKNQRHGKSLSSLKPMNEQATGNKQATGSKQHTGRLAGEQMHGQAAVKRNWQAANRRISKPGARHRQPCLPCCACCGSCTATQTVDAAPGGTGLDVSQKRILCLEAMFFSGVVLV